MRERVENELFFATPSRGEQPSVAESVFYAGRPRPPPEVPLPVRTAQTPIRFALLLFLVGWAGILFQASLLQQVVFGAPVFEELAKLGPPLLVVSVLRIRSLWIRLPLAWASGAAFGVMEHFVTYSSEDPLLYAERVLFHAASPGLSMLFYTAFEDMPDVRSRWAATVPATLFHWANNFGAVVLGLASLTGTDLDTLGLVYISVVTGAMVGLSVVAVARRRTFEARARRVLETAMPRLGITAAAVRA